MRKSVARSFTALIFSPLSAGSFRFSSSLSERCRAAPCFAIRSLQVLRSSSLLERVFNVPCSSLLSDCEAGSSSPESSAKGGMEKKNSFHGYPRTVLTRHHRGQGDLLPPPVRRQLPGRGVVVTASPGSRPWCGGAMRDITQSPEEASKGLLWLSPGFGSGLLRPSDGGWHGGQCAGATREGLRTKPPLSTHGHGSQAQCQCTLHRERTSRGLCKVCFGQDKLFHPRERSQRHRGE